MGRMITQMLEDDKTMEIVAGIDGYTGISNTYPVFPKIEDCNLEVDVVIDFSNAEGIDSLIAYCLTKRLALVLCTTGLSPEQTKAVAEASKKIPVLKSANMSLGINLLLKLVQDATKVLSSANFDIEIVERHHNQKVDAPSGTAMALADSINQVLDEEYSYVYDRSQTRQSRTSKEIGLSAVRGGTIVGEHNVIFAGLDEVFEFKHIANSRSVFGKGAIEAARFLAGKPAGLYTMEDVING
jgi:4-hydroxy-tetrahydrodipicolinate reductase